MPANGVLLVLLKGMKNWLTIAGPLLVALNLLGFLPTVSAQSEGPAVERWRTLLPYNQLTDIAQDEAGVFYCATASGMFSYDRINGDMTAYSKANGMHDIGLTAIGYDAQSGYLLMAYGNSNMDLFKDGLFYNLPDLKLAQINGDKSIHNISPANGLAYVSTGVGLLVVNLEKREIKETVNFFSGSIAASVYDCLIQNDDIY